MNMARLHSDLEQLQTSYRTFQADGNEDGDDDDDDDDSPPSFHHHSGLPWRQNRNVGPAMTQAPKASQGDHPTGGVIIHTVPEGNKSRWSHIEDLDSFFKNVYTYHRKHGFKVMMLQKFSELVQVVFIIFLTVYLIDCVDYDILFNNTQPDGKLPGEKVTLHDVVSPPSQCMTKFSLGTWLFLLTGLSFWAMKVLAIFYQVFQFWDIKLFYNQALHISDGDLGSVTWREVQKRLVEAQSDHLMCIHKEQLTDLDICHRILRFKNYLVAMVNKDILPVRITPLPGLAPVVFLSNGLKLNLEWLFFKGPWAPFDKWHLKDDYKKASKRKELADSLRGRIAVLAALNLLFMPVIFVWQALYCFFNYAELIKREPGSLGVRKWSPYSRLYLRHLNELDHELAARLSRAYKPANQYMEVFVSPMSVVLARFFAFMAGSVLAVFIALSVWDEDVLNVEHILTIITVLGGIVAVSRVFIPDENMAFCPEKTLTAVVAHIHYFPVEVWKGRAHTHDVMTRLSELFPYTAVMLAHEIVSPLVTPFVLFFGVRPCAPTVVDFFRNFTVDVTGVGDVCSFAQMDVRRHGNPNWHEPAPPAASPPARQPPAAGSYARAEAGKTEMSLINFKLANPDWRPPEASENFIAAFRGLQCRDAEALPALAEEQLDANALYSSLTSLAGAAGAPDASRHLLASIHAGAARADADASASAVMTPTPNLRRDLRRLGLEYTGADMSLSALYLHEMHHQKSCHNSPRGAGQLIRRPQDAAAPALGHVAEEELVPLVCVDSGSADAGDISNSMA